MLFRHICPSADAPIVVEATLDVGAAIVLTAGLASSDWAPSHPPPNGVRWSVGRPRLALQVFVVSHVPWSSRFVSVVMAPNFFGDGLRMPSTPSDDAGRHRSSPNRPGAPGSRLHSSASRMDAEMFRQAQCPQFRSPPKR